MGRGMGNMGSMGETWGVRSGQYPAKRFSARHLAPPNPNPVPFPPRRQRPQSPLTLSRHPFPLFSYVCSLFAHRWSNTHRPGHNPSAQNYDIHSRLMKIMAMTTDEQDHRDGSFDETTTTTTTASSSHLEDSRPSEKRRKPPHVRSRASRACDTCKG